MCRFCQDLENIKAAYDNKNTKVRHKQSVALIDYSYIGETRKGSYTKTSDKYKLNFCPMCGRNLREVVDENKAKGTD